MKLKEAWNKFVKSLKGAPSINYMTAYDVAHIDKKVREQTSFEVACFDTRIVNGRRNVGLVIDPSTPADIVAKAEDVFLAAAAERNLNLTREQIIRYVPGTTSKPGRLVQPPAKTW